MGLLRNFLSFNVVVILLLHSIIPHKHHLEMTSEENLIAHQRSDDLIDLLSLAFHQNDAYDFENFITQQYEESIKVYYQDLDIPYTYDFNRTASIFYRLDWYLKIQSLRTVKNFILIPNGLRGPPQ